MDQNELDEIEYSYCVNCKYRKPRASGDCSIYQAIFLERNEFALKSARKIFKNNQCSGFQPKDS